MQRGTAALFTPAVTQGAAAKADAVRHSPTTGVCQYRHLGSGDGSGARPAPRHATRFARKAADAWIVPIGAAGRGHKYAGCCKSIDVTITITTYLAE